MTKNLINFSLLFVVLVLAQALVFNHLVLFGCAIPMVFVLLIVRLPISMSTSQVLTVGFLLGLSVDVFSDTPGLNALACTITAFCRRNIFRIFAPREDDIMSVSPSPRSMGMPAYAKYMAALTVLYCLTVFIVESFGFFHPLVLMLRAAASALYTFVLMLALGAIGTRKAG